jgi:ferredoxin
MVMKICVEVDNSKCEGSLDCGKCMRVCPTAAFKTYPSEVRRKGEICDKWLLTCLPFECIGCEKCEETCQVGAIRVVVS